MLDPAQAAERSRPPRRQAAAGSGRRRQADAARARTVAGPYVSAGPYEGDDGPYEVRLERVPGGVRLARWANGTLARRAPELAATDLAQLVADARERAVLRDEDLDRLEAALAAGPSEDADERPYGASAGSAGDLREELRVERIDDGRLRVARWLFWPSVGWELQDAAVMLPAARYAEAIADAARRGLLPGGG